MLKIQYCSDLHLEFPENAQFLKANPIQAFGDILILAGDIGLFIEIKKYDWFFDDISNKFKFVYWIPGNHEYYYSDIDKRTGSFREEIRHNVFLLNNQVVELEGYQLIFSTLWSKISVNNAWNISRSMSDFHVIKKGDQRFTTEDYNKLFQENYNFIVQALSSKSSELKTIVTTHHVPTFLNYPEKYKGSDLNEAFAVELYEMIENLAPDYWIFGHHHCNLEPFTIGNTTLLTNQLGYVVDHENELFSPAKLI